MRSLAVRKAGFPQNVLTGFADFRRAARRTFLLAIEIEGTVDRLQRCALNRQNELIDARLLIRNHIIERRDKDESCRIEPSAPFGEIAREKDVVENSDELARMRMTRVLCCEARIVFEAWLSDRAYKQRPLALLFEQRQRQPASIP